MGPPGGTGWAPLLGVGSGEGDGGGAVPVGVGQREGTDRLGRGVGNGLGRGAGCGHGTERTLAGAVPLLSAGRASASPEDSPNRTTANSRDRPIDGDERARGTTAGRSLGQND
jgi:hypothetical protein